METVKYFEKNTSDQKNKNRRVRYFFTLSNDTNHDPPPPPLGSVGVVTLKFQVGTPTFLQIRIPQTKTQKSANFQVISMTDDAVIYNRKN